jgi:hypothetical protein
VQPLTFTIILPTPFGNVLADEPLNDLNSLAVIVCSMSAAEAERQPYLLQRW